MSYNINNDSLKEMFSQVGTVESATIIMDKMTGRSKGFGFVEMSSDEEAQKLLKCLMAKKQMEELSLLMKLARWNLAP